MLYKGHDMSIYVTASPCIKLKPWWTHYKFISGFKLNIEKEGNLFSCTTIEEKYRYSLMVEYSLKHRKIIGINSLYGYTIP